MTDHHPDESVKERLARIESTVDYLRERFDEIVVTQIKDHGKRIAALEKRGSWTAGWIAGAMAMGSVLGAGIVVIARAVWGA